MPRLDADQTRAGRGDEDAASNPTEVVMKKVTARAIAAKPSRDTAEIWSAALWLLAAVYLLATVRIY